MKINHFQSCHPVKLKGMTLYSSFNNISLESKAKAVGIREILMKPVTKNNIAEAIRLVLNKEKKIISESADKEKR